MAEDPQRDHRRSFAGLDGIPSERMPPSWDWVFTVSEIDVCNNLLFNGSASGVLRFRA